MQAGRWRRIRERIGGAVRCGVDLNGDAVAERRDGEQLID
jgi:hypothetical protein